MTYPSSYAYTQAMGFDLFVWPADGAATSSARSIRGFYLGHWTRGGMSFWAVSDLNEAEMDEFCEALQL